MKRDVRHMCDLVELGYLRSRISQRLRAWPQDAKMEQRLLAQFGSRAAVERQITERVCYLVAMLAIGSVPEMLLDEIRGTGNTPKVPWRQWPARSPTRLPVCECSSCRLAAGDKARRMCKP